MNHQTICGIDEAGRGAIAGPIVGAAVILDTSFAEISSYIKSPIRDSKTLNKSQRTHVYNGIHQLNLKIHTAIIDVDDINQHGISWANKELFRLLITKTPGYSYIIDGKLKPHGDLPYERIHCVVDADATEPAVILAGIVAKVTRDAFMLGLHENYPSYLFDKNAGYGTAAHRQSLVIYGRTRHHRTLFTDTFLAKTRENSVSTV